MTEKRKTVLLVVIRSVSDETLGSKTLLLLYRVSIVTGYYLCIEHLYLDTVTFDSVTLKPQ